MKMTATTSFCKSKRQENSFLVFVKLIKLLKQNNIKNKTICYYINLKLKN